MATPFVSLTSRFLARLVLVPLALAVLATSASGSPQGSHPLELGDGSRPIDALAVGDDLWIAAGALPPSRVVDLVLRDDAGDELVRRPARTSAEGRLEPRRLWARTGIRGCDCADPVDGVRAYPFVWPAEAEVLVGRTVRVAVEKPGGGTLASRRLPIVARREPLLYPADLEGCPIQLRTTDDAVFFVSDRPVDGPSRLVLAPHQSRWVYGDPLVDVRPGAPFGQSISGSGTVLSVLVVDPGTLPFGEYDLIWRPNDSTVPTLSSADRIVSLPAMITGSGGGRSDGGLVIDDWGCGRPN